MHFRGPSIAHAIPIGMLTLLLGLSHIVLAAGDSGVKRRSFNRLLDAVVRIDVREITFQGGARRPVRGVGSGVILSREGHILTNAHVVSPKAVEISITLANLERVDAELLGWDHWTDLALLQLDLEAVKARKLRFSWVQFGDSGRLLPGQPGPVASQGAPF